MTDDEMEMTTNKVCDALGKVSREDATAALLGLAFLFVRGKAGSSQEIADFIELVHTIAQAPKES